MTPKQVAEKISKNDKYCIRFKLSDRGETVNDLVYGNFVYYVAQNEGDPVILKSDGFPTYHFANVVDDHLMKISHVLRGIEWQISTPKHLMLYRAFNWQPPKFGHLPLIMNADGSKLSKRQNDVKLDYYRQRFIFPQALINYVTQSGGGFSNKLGGALKCYNMEQLTQKFDINRININSSKLNPDLLDELNRLELSNQLEDPEKCKKLIQKVRDLVRGKYPLSVDQLDLDDDHISSVLKWSIKRIKSISELADEKMSFFWVLPKIAKDKEITLNEGNISGFIMKEKVFIILYFRYYRLAHYRTYGRKIYKAKYTAHFKRVFIGK